MIIQVFDIKTLIKSKNNFSPFAMVVWYIQLYK